VTGDPSVAAARAFFGPRAASWDTRFPDDGPAFDQAVTELDLRAGDAAELARVVAAGRRLALFHPVGRAVLAACHGRTLDAGDTLDPGVLPRVLDRSGWKVASIDDGPNRYLALASRVGGS
jgi:hypothetical protein